MTHPLFPLLDKILEYIPDDVDDTLAVLKGHLIIEEELNNKLATVIVYPNAIDKARLSFHQLMLIVKAHFYSEENSWYWDKLKTLNQIRNSLSHNLEPDDLHEKLVSLVTDTENHLNIISNKPFKKRLRITLGILAALTHNPTTNGKTYE